MENKFLAFVAALQSHAKPNNFDTSTLQTWRDNL